MSVERAIEGKKAAVTWWVDDVKMDEKERMKTKTLGPRSGRTNKQIQIMRVLDELIQNRDRNQGNILWTSDWTMWLIDHTRAFRLGQSCQARAAVALRSRLLERLRALTPEALAQAVGASLTKHGTEGTARAPRPDRQALRRSHRPARRTVVLFTL